MRRLSLPIVLASVVVACGGSGSGVGSAPATTINPGIWSGKVQMMTHITGATQELVIIAEGNISWYKDDDENVIPLAGAVRYTPSFGLLTVTYTQSGGGCSEYGTGSLHFEDKDGSFLMRPNGSYNGDVKWRETPPFPTVVTCGRSRVTRPAEVVFLEGFPMVGAQAGGHIKGQWSKTEGDAIYAATWDLTPR